MNLRATLALLAVALGLSAYLYFVETRPKQEEEPEAKRILAVEKERVSALELPLESGELARVVRAGEQTDEWRIEAPIEFPADQTVVAGILSALAGLDAEAVVEAAPDELAPFGLDPGSRRELRVHLGEAAPVVLWLGGKAPLGSTRYVALEGESGRLFTVGDWRVRTLQPQLVNLRDKRMARFEPADVLGVELRERGALVMAARRREPPAEPAEAGGEAAPAEPAEPSWDLVQPIQEEGDSERIRRLVEDLAFARASAFVDEVRDARAYGLNAPELVVSFELAGRTEKLEIARHKSTAYVRVNGGVPVFEANERLLGDVPRKLFEYRAKQVLRVDEVRVRQLDLHFPRDAKEIQFVREDYAWKPVQADLEVESLKIEDVVYALRDLEASGIVEGKKVDPAKLGLELPRVHVVVRGAEGEELAWLDLGDPGQDGIPARSSQSERTWQLPLSIGETIPLGNEAFQNRWLAGDSGASEPGAGEPPAPPGHP
jgi:hypothetical protein